MLLAWRINQNFLPEICDQLTLLIDLYQVLHSCLCADSEMDIANLTLILLDLFKLWDDLKIMANYFLQVDSKLGGEEVRVVVIFGFVNWNRWQVNTEVFDPQLFVFHILDCDCFIPSKSDDPYCHH